jgi:hypothetical protein
MCWSSLRLLVLSVICGSLARHSCLTLVTIDYCRTIASGIGTKYLENLLAAQERGTNGCNGAAENVFWQWEVNRRHPLKHSVSLIYP